MQIHPIANLMPEMSDEDFQALKQDIAENGLLEAIWLTDGQIIDGRHRWRACQELGILPDFREYEGDTSVMGLTSFVISLNFYRRHLDSSQRAVIGLEIEELLAVEAKERQGQRNDLNSNIDFWEKIPKSSRPRQQAAAIVGTNERYLQDAKRLKRDTPDLVDSVRQGTITIPEAKKIAQLEKERRLQALEQIRQGEKPKNVVQDIRRSINESQKEIERQIPSSIELIHGDILAALPAESYFDLVIADPPYNVTGWEWDKFESRTAFLDWTRQVLERLLLHLKPSYNLFWFCSPAYMAQIELLFLELEIPIQSRLVWHRRNMAMGSDSTYKYIDSWECIFHCGNRALNWSGDWSDERFDVQTFAVPQTNFKDAKLHPTQKPLELIQWLVRTASYPQDNILDPFAGSGTTGAACLEIGNRTCTLIEREVAYIEVIKGRLGHD